MCLFSFDTQCGFTVIWHPTNAVCVSVRLENALYKWLIHVCYSSGRLPWAFSPYQVRSTQLWYGLCVCVCVYLFMCPAFVSRLLALPQTEADRHNLHTHWLTLHTNTHMHRLEDKWTLLTHTQRCGQAAFPFECSAKPQTTITLVPVCLTVAEIVCCALSVLQNDDERQQGCDTLCAHTICQKSLPKWAVSEYAFKKKKKFLYLLFVRLILVQKTRYSSTYLIQEE